ncbi:MAG: PCI domain-containing protein [Dehalococcoidia bacterium]|nr:PCI domain-containing protein [Dehalococcoidia bacterium]
MLRRTLTLIAGCQGVCSYDDLARELGVSQALVEQLVADLLRSGCLRMATGECAVEGCASCPLRTSCSLPGGIRLWQLTEKGRRWLARTGEIGARG